jgi:LPXTG-motif cell wall-anchored protein
MLKIVLLVTTLTLLISVPAFAEHTPGHVQADSSGDPCSDPNYPRQTPDGCQASNLPDIPQDNGIVRPPERIPTVAPEVSAPASSATQFQYSTPSASPSAPALPNTGGSSLLALGAGVLLVGGGLLALRTFR